MAADGSWTNQVKNLVIVAGTGTSGVFVYDPTAGTGNLIASLTDATADPYGNVTKKGVTAYIVSGGDIYAVNLNQVGPGGAPMVSLQDITSPPNVPGGVTGFVNSAQATVSLISGKETGGDVSASVNVQSATNSGITSGLVRLLAGQVQIGLNSTVIVNDQTNQESANLSVALPAAPSSPATGPALYSNASGNLATVTPSGLAGTMPVTQVDLSTHSAGNTATATDVTKVWTIPAANAVAGTVYTLRGHLTVNTGQTTIETLTLGIDLNNSVTGPTTALATLGTAFNGGALNTSYDVPFELRIAVDANGADTPQVVLNATLADLSANRLSTNSANMHGHANGLTFTKASSNTIALYAQWGGAGGSAQNAQTIWSELVREGP